MGLCAFSPLHYTLKQSASIRGKESGPFTSVGHAILSEGLPASYLPWSGTREQLVLSPQV